MYENNYLNSLSVEELKSLKEAMLAARESYRAAMKIIGKGSATNSSVILHQQAMLEDFLREYVQGAGLSYISEISRLDSGNFREYLKPLDFSDEELPDYSLPDIK